MSRASISTMGLDEYPQGYDRAKHGPFDPARYYGKPDTPFGEVKLQELPSWLMRREKSPQAICSAISRACWRWKHKYVYPRRGGIAPFFQIAVGCSIFFYILNYGKIKHHKNYKYH